MKLEIKLTVEVKSQAKKKNKTGKESLTWQRKAHLHKNTHLSVSGVMRYTFYFHWSYWIHINYSTLEAEDKPAHICKGFFKCRGEHFDILLQQGGIGACDPRQFSFQPDSYQQRSYQDPSSNSEVRSWINLKSISRSSVTPTGADLRVWHWEDNHLKGKQQYAA